jgi:hypothetical protein
MKAIKPTRALLVATIAMASLVAIAETVAVPMSEATYPPIPMTPHYIHMDDSFQVYTIHAP